MHTRTLGKQAVVIGGSIAGLAAARALSSHFETVLVVERDEQPQRADPRKAIPQGHHVHVLLKSGERALESLFPGLIDELQAAGARLVDASRDVRWFHAGQWKLRYESGFMLCGQSRPLLEQTIRRRVQALGNVSFRYGMEAESLLGGANGAPAAGVRLRRLADRTHTEDIEADLVVDASGRGSKLPQWLEAMGYRAPPETRLNIGLTYTSRLYDAPPDGTHDWLALLVNPHGPHALKGGYIFGLEGGRWLVTLAGYSGVPSPKDKAQFLAYAESLAQPDVYEAIRGRPAISDIKSYAVPQTIRRHYEKLGRMPAQLVVMGDALCAFDPVFGQGMSVAAKEAVALDTLLASGSLADVGRRFHTQAARIVEVPWMLSTSEDFRFRATEGRRPLALPILHWYSGHIFTLSGDDRQVYDAFRQVMHLLDGVGALFAPGIVLKVLRHALRRRPHRAATAPEPAATPSG